MSERKCRAAVMRNGKVYSATGPTWVSAIKKLQSLLELENGKEKHNDDYFVCNGSENADAGRTEAATEPIAYN